MKSQGFTLIELVVLLVILSILSTIVGVRLSSLHSFNSYSFATILQSDLNLTRALSIAKNQRYRLVIGGTSYQIQDQNGAIFLNPETNTNTVTYPSGTTVSPSTTIVFDSLGQPYNAAGTTPLSDPLNITITSTQLSQVMSVTPQTGLIQ